MLRGALEPWHVIIIVALLFVLFGAKRMPDASRSLARSMKIFKNEVKDLRSDDDETVTPEIAATPATPVVTAPAAGATAVTVPAATAPAATVPATSTSDEVALREAELRLAEARVNELRARTAAQSEHERV